MTLDFALIANTQCRLGEGPVYDERTNRLYFVDIVNRKVLALELASGELKSWVFESEVGSLGLTVSGKLVVALRHSVIVFDPANGTRRELCQIEQLGEKTRTNDGKVGPDGAFWVGTMDDRPTKEPIGTLYRVDSSGKLERKVEGVQISNGLAWTADGDLMFYADTRGPWIDRWKFDRRTGAMSERTRFAAPDAEGRPDGGSCDAEGLYWSAGVSAGRLNRFAPDGKLVKSFPVPVAAPTMPCFGGTDFRTIFLTSLREGRSEDALAKAPWTGSLIAARSPVVGFPAWRFIDT